MFLRGKKILLIHFWEENVGGTNQNGKRKVENKETKECESSTVAKCAKRATDETPKSLDDVETCDDHGKLGVGETFGHAGLEEPKFLCRSFQAKWRCKSN